MGLDLYIEAKITEKATERCITMPDTEEARKRLLDPYEFDPEECQYFTVLWMCGWEAAVPRNSWIDIINRYLKTNYSYEDIIIPFPQSALREMCSCLFSNAIFPEDNRFLYPEYGIEVKLCAFTSREMASAKNVFNKYIK